ncbi:carboxypeptidase regulatory-like domain-containing protein [Solicola sp. PLA-1-18]|uniref:carboxypeptidase regulatory-like domain-containing protein n=1 Tax=Solicola sp. PLA-1-18 TaxID=3380532 RepID=UPI003B7A6B36
MGRRPFALVTACLLVAGAVALGSPASAARTTGWATWSDLGGSPNAYTATMQLPGLSFPEATVRSDSRGGGVGVQSGASAFFNAATPPGQQFGSSEGRRYLNLRPKADTPTGGSTTTYTFDAPTPAGGWAMILGDVDADQVRVTALRADGTEATAAELGNKQSFNACSYGTPRTAGCASSVGDFPVWSDASQTLTGSTGTPAFADTVGATGWFRPTVSLRSITLTYTARSGFPVFQTWFAAVNRGITGTIAVPAGAGACTITGTTVRLLTADGVEVDTTTAAIDGTYSFDGLATRTDYRVVVEPADGCAAVGPRERTVSTLVGRDDPDPVADFQVRAIVPQPVSGRVTSGTGAAATGVGGVVVTITPTGGGTPRTTTTDPDGRYLFDENATGIAYEVSIDVPAGYTTADDVRDPFTVDTEPVTDQDFALAALPSVSGTVTGGGGPLGGVQVTATPSGGGTALTTATAADGTYAFPGLADGTYTIEVTEPDGYATEPSLTAVVAGADLTGRDFALSRPGSVGGQVTDADGAAVPGVQVVVDGPGVPQTVVTDADGGYFVDGLGAGDYTVTPTAPDGLEVRGDDSETVTITAAGEAANQGFVLVAEAVAPPTTPPTEDEPGGDDAGTGTGDDASDDDAATGVSAPAGSLPDTGGPSRVLLALGATTAGAGALVLAGDAVRRRRRA